jgi:hypothetical protein
MKTLKGIKVDTQMTETTRSRRLLLTKSTVRNLRILKRQDMAAVAGGSINPSEPETACG